MYKTAFGLSEKQDAETGSKILKWENLKYSNTSFA